MAIWSETRVKAVVDEHSRTRWDAPRTIRRSQCCRRMTDVTHPLTVDKVRATFSYAADANATAYALYLHSVQLSLRLELLLAPVRVDSVVLVSSGEERSISFAKPTWHVTCETALIKVTLK